MAFNASPYQQLMQEGNVQVPQPQQFSGGNTYRRKPAMTGQLFGAGVKRQTQPQSIDRMALQKLVGGL